MGLLSFAGNLANDAGNALAGASGAAWNAVGQPLFNAAFNGATGYKAPVVNPQGQPGAAAPLPGAAAASGGGGGGGGSSAFAAPTTLTPSQAHAIAAGFDAVLKNYDAESAGIPGQIDDAVKLVNNQADGQKSSIDSSYGRGNVNLQAARDQTQTQTQRSLQKLAQTIRDSFNSYSTMIGANGAGDSSANGQLSYALQKEQAQQRTDLYNNEGDNMTQINLKQGDLDANHMDLINQLNTWKNNQILTIGQQFKQAQQAIEDAKAGASKDKLLALANANSDLVNQAVSALSGVTAQHQSAVQQINDRIAAAQAPGDPSTLSGTTYNPTAAPSVRTPLFAAPTGATGGDSFASAVPYTKKLQLA